MSLKTEKGDFGTEIEDDLKNSLQIVYNQFTNPFKHGKTGTTTLLKPDPNEPEKQNTITEQKQDKATGSSKGTEDHAEFQDFGDTTVFPSIFFQRDNNLF